MKVYKNTVILGGEGREGKGRGIGTFWACSVGASLLIVAVLKCSIITMLLLLN